MGTLGRKDLYESVVKPKLDKIKEWNATYTEEQIARDLLHIAKSTFQKYKKDHPELAKALLESRAAYCEELKATMKKKALGFHYTETKTIIRVAPDGSEQKVVERYERYAQPDTGAMHLLLKNLDPDWHNDDVQTLKLKKEQVEIAKKKAEEGDW